MQNSLKAIACGFLWLSLAATAMAAPPPLDVVGDPPPENLIINPGFETDQNLRPEGEPQPAIWMAYGKRGRIVTGVAHSGARSAFIERPATAKAAESDGQSYVLAWRKPWKYPLRISAWAKAEGAHGAPLPAATGVAGAAAAEAPADDTPDNAFALYCDIIYAGGGKAAQGAPFRGGTHDWQQAFVDIVPEQPIQQINIYLFFRVKWHGRVWFDDVKAAPLTGKTPTNSWELASSTMLRPRLSPTRS